MRSKKQIRVLVSRIDRIGDVVLSTPIPREIKKAYPDSFVAVLVKKYTKDIYINNPYIDKIILYDDDGKGNFPKYFQLTKQIRKLKFSHAFMLLPNERLNWLLFIAGIPIRIGVGHKLYQFLSFSKYVDRNKYIPLRHEADYCMDMVRKIGIEPQSIEPEIHLTQNEVIERNELAKSIAPNGELIVGIHTTSGKSSPNLSPVEYRDLALRLAADKNIKVVITDINPPKELQNLESVNYPRVGNSLREDIVLFASLDVLISSSTGPMHICAALKIPTISLFCPLTACSPKLWGPLGNESRIILPEENYCSTVCPGDPHICDFSGKGGINSDKVYHQLMTFASTNKLN